jgi:hypothetical protein
MDLGKTERRRGVTARTVSRRPTSLILLVFASLASIATSPPEEDIYSTTPGPRVELASHRPEATVEVELDLNSEAASAPTKRVVVRTTPVWDAESGGRSPGEVLELAVINSEGRVLARGSGETLTCDIEACIGLAEIQFRLLDPEAGTLVVNWELDVYLHFGEGKVPNDAEMNIAFGSAGSGTTEVAASGTVSSQGYHPGAVRIQIHAPDGVPHDAEVQFEPLLVRQPAVLLEEQEVHIVTERTRIGVTAPERCHRGSCDWSVLLIAGQADWQLVAPPDIPLEVGVATVTPGEVGSVPVSGEPVRLEAEESARLVANVEVDPSLLSGPLFATVDPSVVVEFTLTWDDPDARLIVARDSGFGMDRQDDPTLVADNRVPLLCDALRCHGSVDLVMEFLEGEGTVSWQARAYVSSLVPGTDADDGLVRLEVFG